MLPFGREHSAILEAADIAPDRGKVRSAPHRRRAFGGRHLEEVFELVRRKRRQLEATVGDSRACHGVELHGDTGCRRGRERRRRDGVLEPRAADHVADFERDGVRAGRRRDEDRRGGRRSEDRDARVRGPQVLACCRSAVDERSGRTDRARPLAAQRERRSGHDVVRGNSRDACDRIDREGLRQERTAAVVVGRGQPDRVRSGELWQKAEGTRVGGIDHLAAVRRDVPQIAHGVERACV